jgi:hypothetical protein
MQGLSGAFLRYACRGRIVDTVEEGFDAGIRLGESVPRDMIDVRCGGPIRFIAVASESSDAARITERASAARATWTGWFPIFSSIIDNASVTRGSSWTSRIKWKGAATAASDIPPA